jgi:aconitase A
MDTLKTFTTGSGSTASYHSLPALKDLGIADVSRLPVSIRIVLESLLRNLDGRKVTESDIKNLANWNAKSPGDYEVPFTVARVVLQDFTGVPLVVDLAAMRDAAAKAGADPSIVEPLVPVDLVVDHSVQVDFAGSQNALDRNLAIEFIRNQERYEFLKWGQQAFDTFGVVPPGIGIVHQVNLEHLATGVLDKDNVFYPDTLVGTDSHTTMINGLGVVGWGVGGIEAEAGMLGQPVTILVPEVVGVYLHGELTEGVTATDLTLRITEMLRAHGVVGKFVEFYGPGTEALSLPDRATIANMAPEYGATMGFFPIDSETINYLRGTGRPEELCTTVTNYFKAQEMWGIPQKGEIDYTDDLSLDLSSVVPAVSGPKRPQDRIDVPALGDKFNKLFSAPVSDGGFGRDASTRNDVAALDLSTPAGFSPEGAQLLNSDDDPDNDVAIETLGQDKNGNDVYLKDLWPSSAELSKVIDSALKPEVFNKLYSELNTASEKWIGIESATGDTYDWNDDSTYIQNPPFFPEGWRNPATKGKDIIDARPLGVFGDSVTTDHISPAGAITPTSPAGQYLLEHGVEKAKFNSFGSRRGNDRIMTRGTFGNVRIKNLMTPGIEGGYTQYFGDAHVAEPDQEIKAAPNAKPTFIYDAAIAYQQSGRKLIVIAGEDYGMGSSRDWAAKGTALLGVKAVITKSYERIHRSNLIGMGVLPLTFKDKSDYDKIKDMHSCTFSITGLAGKLRAGQDATLTTSCGLEIPLVVRLDTPAEIDYYLSGGILPYVLNQILDQ